MTSEREDQLEDMARQEMALEAERKLREQQIATLSRGADMMSTALRVLSHRSMVFFALFCVLFLFSWVMFSPNILRVVGASLASVAIWFIVKFEWKEK